MLITQFSLFFGFCPLNGETNGILEINDSQIIYGDKEIDFNDIVDINFNMVNMELIYGDYYGRSATTDVFSTRLSQGVGNTIKIKTIAGEDILLHYRLNDKEHIQQLMPIIRMLAIQGKMPVIRAVSLLKLNYKEVQELKAEMATGES